MRMVIVLTAALTILAGCAESGSDQNVAFKASNPAPLPPGLPSQPGEPEPNEPLPIPKATCTDYPQCKLYCETINNCVPSSAPAYQTCLNRRSDCLDSDISNVLTDYAIVGTTCGDVTQCKRYCEVTIYNCDLELVKTGSGPRYQQCLVDRAACLATTL